jgi:glucokinase
MKLLALDVGGTFVKYAIVDKQKDGIKFLEHGRFKNRDKEEHPSSKDIIHDVAKFAKTMHKKYPNISAVCSTFGGPIDTENGTTFTIHQKFSNHNNINLKEEFAKFCELPFYVINDVRAGALGEITYGCLKQKKDFDAVFLAIGTGICSAFIIDGHIYSGDKFQAGEIGPIVVNNHFFENHYAVPALIKRCQEVDKTIVDGEDCLKRMKKNVNIKNIVDA